MGRLNFEALKHLHSTANDILHSTAMVDHRQEKWLHEVSEASLRILDVCGDSKDVLLLVKEHLQELQFTLRRVTINIGELSNMGNKIADYNCYRKKLKKKTVKCLNSLKGIVKSKSDVDVVPGLIKPVDDNLTVVVDVLREVRMTTVSIVESLLSLIHKPWLEQKSSKGHSSFNLASKFQRTSSTEQSLYDIYDTMQLQSANKRLEAVKITIEYIEVELDSIFRRLIQTRVALLNILTN